MEWIQQNWLVVALGLLVILALIIVRALGQRTKLPYEPRGKLLTKSEAKFFHTLQQAAGERWTIFAMVRIADLLKVKSGTQKYLSWFNRISSKHVDFVLCEGNDLAPKIAIELDDRSHERPDRQERDRFVNQAFEDAKFPLVRIPTQDDYDAGNLRTLIEQAGERFR